MKLKLVVALFLSVFALDVIAYPADNPIKRVLYITLDGVRWQDILNQRQLMPVFWSKYSSQAKIYGGFNQNDHIMEVASTPISLPSYQSQMAGSVTSCQHNECGGIQTETFPEYLVKSLHMSPKDVVAVSCWATMKDAIEQNQGTITSNCGNQAMKDPDTHLPDFEMLVLNTLQSIDYIDNDERFDKYTYAQALHYLQKYKPKFMYLSLGEADDFAHDGDHAAYLKAINYYDGVLDVLFTSLKEMSIYDETLIIVTTDHGRGNGKEWRHHGDEYNGSKNTWAFVFNGELAVVGVKDGVKQYSTLSIRPTVENVFRNA